MTLAASHPALDPRALDGLRVIEADAGTGKTWTLSALVVRAIVEREVPVAALLVITFTRAAAAELESRIRDRLAEAAQACEAVVEGADAAPADPFLAAWLPTVAEPRAAALRLRLAIARLEEATLSTIHGFAERVLREHAFTVSAPTHPAAADPRRRWLEVGFDEAWQALVIAAPGEARRRLRTEGVTHAGVRALVERLAAHPQARPQPDDDDWAGRLAAIDAARQAVVDAVRREGEAVMAWLAADASHRRSPHAQKSHHVRAWIATLRGLETGTVEDAVNALQGLRAGGDAPMPAVSVERFVLFDRCEALLALGPPARALAARVALACWRRIRARRFALRDAHGGGGFDDGLERIDEALADPGRGPALAAALAARWRVVFVDECQDTDPLQARVLSAAFGAGRATMVLVGDPKQSIYRFRGADLHAYLSLRARAADVLRLGENQRSDPGVLHAIAQVFARDDAFVEPGIGFIAPQAGQRARARLAGPVPPPMTVVRVPGVGDPTADDGAQADADGEAGAVDGEESEGREGEEASQAGDAMPVGGDPPALRAVADAVAAEIARLLAAGLHFEPPEPGGALDRPAALQPADVAVLVATHAQGGVVRRALARRGIGATEVTRDHVTRTREARDLALWLAALDAPGDARRVRAAIACASFGLPADRVAPALDGDAFRAAVAALVAAREHWVRRGPLGALRQWLRDAGVIERLAGFADGERRLTNLLHLLELLAEDRSAAVSPARALRWLRETSLRPGTDPEALELRIESDARLVRIVTQHRSKGLEFPIVFVPFAFEGRRIDPADARVFHDPDGAAVLDLGVVGNPDDTEAAVREAWAEQVRLLYVALTRARHALYVGWGPTPAARIAPLAWLWHGVEAVGLATKKGAGRGAWDVARFDAELAERARSSGGAIRVVALESLGGGPGDASPAIVDGETAAAVPVERRVVLALPPPWQRTSFTAWLQGADREAPGDRDADHDVAAVPGPQTEPAAAPAQAQDDVRHRLPAGAATGIALHAILEHAPPGRAVTHDAAGQALRAAGLGADPDLAAAVAGWIETVRDWPLPVVAAGAPGEPRVWTERDLVPGRHRREWAFDLATGRDPVDADALCAAAARAGPLPEGLALGRWRGFLRGVVDLVAEVDGRYVVVDWKSNRLGNDADAYRPAALAASMREAGYVLQGCLYAVALHRHLRARRVDYDPRRHFGGVHYVFLRGLAPGAPVDNGIWSLAIDATVLEALDAALGLPPGATA